MSKRASQPWQEVFKESLGEGRLDGSALREYFVPLEEWLHQKNLRTNEFIGWNYEGDYCRRSIETANLQVFGGYYNAAEQQAAKSAKHTLHAILNIQKFANYQLYQDRIHRFFVGDAGYLLEPFVMTPYRSSEESSRKKYFSDMQRAETLWKELKGYWVSMPACSP